MYTTLLCVKLLYLVEELINKLKNIYYLCHT